MLALAMLLSACGGGKHTIEAPVVSETDTIEVPVVSETDTIEVPGDCETHTTEVPEGGGICDRTEQVCTAILTRITGIGTCGAVTDAHLAAITGVLDLYKAGISSLQADDFSGLTGLTTLNLIRNELSALPPGVFDDLTNLRTLYLTKNRLYTLTNKVFASLNGLNILDLEYNQFTTLPLGEFAGLDLQFLGLEGNKLRKLPVGVFADLDVKTLDLSHNQINTLSAEVFSDLTSLTHLDLSSNQLDTLPAGVFDGLTSLWSLWLDKNPGANFTFNMMVERRPGTNEVVVTVAQGAPFDMTTTISATGGTLPAGVSSVTVPAGRTTSDEISVTPLEGTTVILGMAPPVPSELISSLSGVLRFYGVASAVGGPVPFLNTLAKDAGANQLGISGWALSVADAHESEGAAAEFRVMLRPASARTVTVDYATEDGTARAGVDYEAASGTLTFAPGETGKTVSVTVLGDAADDSGEIFVLRLFNASGATLADAEATGIIANSDPLSKAWLTRFGRMAAGHVIEAVNDRMRGAPDEGVQATIADRRVRLNRNRTVGATREQESWKGVGLLHDTMDDFELLSGLVRNNRTDQDTLWDGLLPRHWADEKTTRSVTGQELLTGSTFHYATSPNESNLWTFWGQGAFSRFNSRDDASGFTPSGDVSTVTIGTDFERYRWLVGIALSYSKGDGTFSMNSSSGVITSSLSGLYPYMRFEVDDRFSLWSLFGHGQGTLSMTEENKPAIKTNIGMSMQAAGARGELLSVRDSHKFVLGFKTDVLLLQADSHAKEGLLATEADVSRLRLILEGSWAYELDGGGSLTPSFETGLRYDEGDAETGFGIEIGGRLSHTNLELGLTADMSVRGLLTHDENGFEEWGVSGSVRIDPSASGHGISLILTPAWGSATSGVERLWSLHDAHDLVPNDNFDSAGRLDAELGYAFGALGGLGVQTPYAGFTVGDQGDQTIRLGWRLKLGPDVNLEIEGMQREGRNDDAIENSLMLRGSLRW